MGALSNGPIPDPLRPPNPQTGRSKSPHLKLQPYRQPQIEHILSGRRAAWSSLWWWPCCLFMHCLCAYFLGIVRSLWRSLEIFQSTTMQQKLRLKFWKIYSEQLQEENSKCYSDELAIKLWRVQSRIVMLQDWPLKVTTCNLQFAVDQSWLKCKDYRQLYAGEVWCNLL